MLQCVDKTVTRQYGMRSHKLMANRLTTQIETGEANLVKQDYFISLEREKIGNDSLSDYS